MCKSDTHILINKVNLTVRNGNIKTAFERPETDVLMCIGTPLFFHAIFTKGDNFSDSLFALLAGEALTKRVCS